MNKTNKVLVVLVIVLSVLVLALSGYVIYDKVMKEDDTFTEQKNNTDDTSSNTVLPENEALTLIKNLAKRYFEYSTSLGAYCGETDHDDYISFGSYETQDFRDYCASTTYSSISELKAYYESVMTKELLPSYLDNGVSYIEKDGKLYCQLPHKGCGDTYKEEASLFVINTIQSDRIAADVILSSETCGPLLTSREGNIEITKKSDGNWVISKYDVVVSDLD